MKLRLLAALLLAATALVSPSAQPVLAETAAAKSPLIAAGRLVNANGDAHPGTVEVLAWPGQQFTRVGDTFQLVPVARAATAADGSYELRAAPSPEVRALAQRNGGYVNLVVRSVDAPSPMDSQNIYRYLSPVPMGLAGSAGGWRQGPDEEASGTVDIVVPEGARPNRPFRDHCFFNNAKLLERRDAVPTIIGELQTGPDTKHARFEYGERADTDVGVGVRAEGGSWSVSGEHHVANTHTSAIAKNARSNSHLQIFSAFDYGRYRVFNQCYMEYQEVIRPIDWHPELTDQFYPNPGCGPKSRNVSKFTPDTSFVRDSERAVTWGGAASVFGASLSARSGYSRFVRASWKFGSGDELHYLCGDDRNILRSARIYAGPVQEIVECVEGRPC